MSAPGWLTRPVAVPRVVLIVFAGWGVLAAWQATVIAERTDQMIHASDLTDRALALCARP